MANNQFFVHKQKRVFFCEFSSDKGFAIIIFLLLLCDDSRLICDIRLAFNYCPTVNNVMLNQLDRERWEMNSKVFSMKSFFCINSSLDDYQTGTFLMNRSEANSNLQLLSFSFQ